jgi:tetratricopeptide (TPR) repeat protein
MTHTLAESRLAAALQAAHDSHASAAERAERLMELAVRMQLKPESAQQLREAVALYRCALTQAPLPPLLAARIRSKMGTALQSLPDGGVETLQEACECHELALPVLSSDGEPQEAAQAHLSLGLAIQALCGLGLRRVQEAIQHYQQALRTFTGTQFPREFAILHNNLAIAYLATPATDERSRLRQTLAVQSFEAVLEVVNATDHPCEYAMIQNNLGNALQYAAQGPAPQNGLRALAAYDEALKVRNPRDTPIDYANTIANKANVLRRHPVEGLEGDGLSQALELYREARRLFEAHALPERAELMTAAIAQIAAEQPRAGDSASPGQDGHTRQ